MGDAFFTFEVLAFVVAAAMLLMYLRPRGGPVAAPEQRTEAIARLVRQIEALEQPRGACAGARPRSRRRVRGRHSLGRSASS